MGLLSSLLPGLRDLRAPLAAGSIWLLVIWLAVDPSPPDEAHATGIWKSVLELDGVASAVGRGAAITFGIYLLGSISEAVMTGISNWVTRYRDAYTQLRSGSPSQKPRWFGWHLRLAIRTLPPRDETTTAGRRDRLSGAGERSLSNFIGVRLDDVTRQLLDVGVTEKEVNDWKAIMPVEGRPDANSPTEGPRPELDHETLQSGIVNDFGLIRRRLIGKEPEFFSEIDRLRSEAELREAIAAPLVALAVVVAYRVHGTGAAVGWATLGCALAALLFWQARLRRRDAGDALVDALVIGRVDAPVLDRLAAAVKARSGAHLQARRPPRAASPRRETSSVDP